MFFQNTVICFQVLTFDPEFVDAMFFCGVALKESADVRIGSPMDMRNRIGQAIIYFEVFL